MKEPSGKNVMKKSKPVELDMASPWQKYANVVLIPIIIALTVFLLVRFRANAAAEAQIQERMDLTTVRTKLDGLRNMDPARMAANQEQLAMIRDAEFSETAKLIDKLLASAKDAPIRAEALLAQGDLNWLLANFPQLPGATTRPSLAAPKSADEDLAAAEKAYKSVLTDYVDQRLTAISAHMGLAAIAENRHDWTEAVKNYQTVADDKTAPASFSLLAKQRIQLLDVTKQPLYLGHDDALSTRPTIATPATLPTIEPTTRPAATTRPASTQPAH